MRILIPLDLEMHLFFVKGMEVLDLLRHSNCYPSLPHALYRCKQASPSLVIKRFVSGASRDLTISPAYCNLFLDPGQDQKPKSSDAALSFNRICPSMATAMILPLPVAPDRYTCPVVLTVPVYIAIR